MQSFPWKPFRKKRLPMRWPSSSTFIMKERWDRPTSWIRRSRYRLKRSLPAGDAAEPGTEDGSGETGSAAQEPEDTEEPTETASVDPEKTDGRFSMKLPKAVIPGVILAVLAALGAGLWMVWIRKRRKEEAEAAARRRERRRQRLMEEGPEAAAEFNRLLEEKKNRSQGRGHRR